MATTRTLRLQNTLGVCRPDGSVVHYRGTVEFWDTAAGTRVVNNVLVEQYLRGVVPREVPASWGAAPNGMEALKAQAVAARSYGVSQTRNYPVGPSGSAVLRDHVRLDVVSGLRRRRSAAERRVAGRSRCWRTC